MRRKAIAALLAIGACLLFAVPAAAQEAPNDDYPPAQGASVSASGALLPGAVVDITVGCSALVAGQTYSGTLDGASIGTGVAADGSVTFEDVTIPEDFELEAFHTIEVADSNGIVVCSAQFYVDSEGNITSGPVTVTTEAPGTGATGGTGALPRTGSDFTETGLRVGGAAVALGAVAVAIAAKRRRTARAAA